MIKRMSSIAILVLLAAGPAFAQQQGGYQLFLPPKTPGVSPAPNVVLPPRPPGFAFPKDVQVFAPADCAVEKFAKFRLQACNSVLAKDPSAAWAYYVRSTSYRESKEYELAFADLIKTVELDPKLTAARIERDHHVADLQKAVEFNPRGHKGHTALGTAYEMMGNREAMIATYKMALSLVIEPDTVSEFNARGWYNLKIGAPAIGLLEVDKALAMDPKHAPSRDTRGQILEAMGRTAEAVDELRVALSLAPFMKASKDALARIKPTEFVTAEVKSRKLRLPVPPGYCALGTSILERRVHTVFKGIHEKGGADLLLLAMRCGDVAQLRKGQPLAVVDRIVSITTFKVADFAVGPVTPQQRAAFVQERARGVGTLKIEDVARFANKASEGIVTQDPSKTRMRVVEVTGTAAYTAFAGQSTPVTGGTASNDTAITGMTLIDGVPLLVKIGGGEQEQNPYEDLLIDAKVAVALLLDVKAE
jgi:tetratricopeptide (TPR) repeat protein